MVDPCQNGNEGQDGGTYKFPQQSPQDSQGSVQIDIHLRQVVEEVLRAVDPNRVNDFKEANEQEAGGAPFVKDGEE